MLCMCVTCVCLIVQLNVINTLYTYHCFPLDQRSLEKQCYFPRENMRERDRVEERRVKRNKQLLRPVILFV